MQRRLAWLVLLVAVAQADPASRAPQTPAEPGPRSESGAGSGQEPPTFRAGTDLLTLEVSVVDGRGRPVQGLRPADFTVRIKGESRRVVAAELVKSDAGGAGPQPRAAGNVAPGSHPAGPAGRRVLIAVDQQHIPPGSIKPLLNAAAQFVDRLTPRDQAAFVAFPEPGPRVDFTSDLPRVRQAMQAFVGQPPRISAGLYDIGLGEALIVSDQERVQTDTVSDVALPPPVVADIMARNCRAEDDVLECRRRVISESAQIAQEARLDARISIRTLESIIARLVPLEGNKSLVLISASLPIDDHRELDRLRGLAEAARMTLSVIVVEPLRETATTSRVEHTQAPTEMTDRRVREGGLTELADGRLFRMAGTGEAIFDRLALEMSASYVLGVESRPEDLGKDVGRVDVAVRRQGVRARVSQAFVRTPAPRVKTLEETLRDALTTRSSFADLPVQVATFSRWDPGSDKVRVNLTAEIGPPGIQPGDYMVGYIIADRENQVVAEWSLRQKGPGADSRRESKPFGSPVLLSPGEYSVHVAIVDAGGRVGTVVHDVNVARSMSGDMATSDLVVGSRSPGGELVGLGVEPHVTGKVAAYLELYAGMPGDLDWTLVAFEIAESPTSPALAEAPAEVVEGALPSWRVATGIVDASTLAPGRYVARARIVRDGETSGVLTRPFVLTPAQPPVPAPDAK